MPEDQLSKIFNPFYTTKTNGTGLGMGIAKKVMDAHNGRIEVHSEAGSGTEFLISIPVADALRAGLKTEPRPADATDHDHDFEPVQPSGNGNRASADGADHDALSELRFESGTRQ